MRRKWAAIELKSRSRFHCRSHRAAISLAGGITVFTVGLALLSQAQAARFQGDPVVDGAEIKEQFLSERERYQKDMSALLLNSAESFPKAAQRSGRSFVIHVGVSRELALGLELVELRFENSLSQARIFSTSDLARSRLRWMSFKFDKIGAGTQLFQVRLKYRGSGAGFERWGAGTLLANTESGETYFALNRSFQDLSRVQIEEIDINKAFTDPLPNGQPAPDRGLEFFFFKPKRNLFHIGEATETIKQVKAPVTDKLDKQLMALIDKHQYNVALDCLDIDLASSQPHSINTRVRLFVLKALLESVLEKSELADRSLQHAEELFWSTSAPKPEAWDAATTRIFFSLNVAKKDMKRLRPL